MHVIRILILALTIVLQLYTHSEDKIYSFYLEDKGQGQKCRMWIPDGVTVVRGILMDMGWAHGGDRADLQAFARANSFATMGSLLRWPATLRTDLKSIVSEFAKRSSHPELNNVPWILHGFSRSVPQCGKVAAGDTNQVLAIIAGGAVVECRTPASLENWNHCPVMNVNGSLDPFIHSPEGVTELRWFSKDYPALREKHVPWGAAIQWGAAHTPGTGFVMHAAFLKDVLPARFPESWDPTKEIPKLREPISETQGWVGDVSTWSNPCPAVCKFSEFRGEVKNTHWLPGSYSAHVWRAYVVKDPQVQIEIQDGAVSLTGKIPAGTTKAIFFDGDQMLNETSISNGACIPFKLPMGLCCIYAICETGTEKYISRPTLVLDGKQIPLGEDSARPTTEPLALIELEDVDKKVLQTLAERSQYKGAMKWEPCYTADFSGGLGPWKPGSLPGKAEVIEGSLQLSSKDQFMIGLPYDWPHDLAIDYRCKSVGEKVNDMAVMLGAVPEGDRPWRDGIMFHFGAKGNAATYFQVAGDDTKDLGVTISSGQWHEVHVERVGDTLSARIDGKKLEPVVLPALMRDRIRGFRIGLYTFSNTAQFRDFKVSLSVPEDANMVVPVRPSQDQMEQLASNLLNRLDSPYAEQRNLGKSFLGQVFVDLLPILRTLKPSEKAGANQTRYLKELQDYIQLK